MKRYIKTSAGDVHLHKFVFVPMGMVDDIPQNYDSKLGGYFYVWEYTYNKLTGETDDRMYSHADVLDNLPWEIRKQSRELTVWGKTDWYNDSKRFIAVNQEHITPSQIAYIRRRCKM